MPNFNSREVARLIIESNIGRTFSEGDDPIGDAAKILDSALLAAHPEAKELAIDVYHILDDWDGSIGDANRLEIEASAKIAAALESAKREAAPKWVRIKENPPPLGKHVLFRDGNHVPYVGKQTVVGIDVYGEECKATHWMPLPPFGSLAEKEGGR